VADLEAENNLTSITQVSSLEEFMANAVAAGREFTAIKTNATIIDGTSGPKVPEKYVALTSWLAGAACKC